MVLLFSFLWLYTINTVYTWLGAHLHLMGSISVSVSIDHYSTTFFWLLGIVSISVLYWSYYYMDCELSYKRFYILLFMFIMSMVGLIFFSNLYMTLIGWDGLGVSSFLLIIYYKNRKSLGSGMITALSNRMGDCLFLCLLGFFIYSDHILLLSLLICMSMTKSAQFPFTAWLPAAMAAPTPVSALVHSSTLVTAGVYVLIRYCGSDMTILQYLGSCTMVLAGMAACVESDLKKVVALSTLSQLGVMMVGLGVHEKSYCFFHLLSHACFKALLFLCVGTSIHMSYGSQEYRSYNLTPKLLVSIAMMVATISLMGFMFTSGFYSKDKIIEALLGEKCSWVSTLFFLGVGLTSCYSMKMLLRGLSMTSAGSSTTAGGGFSSQVNVPLMLMGFLSLFFGTSVGTYCNPNVLILCSEFNTHHLNWDLLFAPILILIGFCVGASTPRNCTFYSSMCTIVPWSQHLAHYSVHTGNVQSSIDKGWVEMSARSISPFTNSVIASHTPTVCIGMSITLIYFLFYVEYIHNVPLNIH